MSTLILPQQNDKLGVVGTHDLLHRILAVYDDAPEQSLVANSDGSISGQFGLVAGNGAIDPSAIMQANSTTQGFLPPRMTTTDRDAIAAPAVGLILYNTTTGKLTVRNASTWTELGSGSGGGGTWGSITGILSDQTDLQNALNAKYNASNPAGYISGISGSDVVTALGYVPYDDSNPDGFISGITGGMVTSALGYTPYNATNPSGYISGITSGMVTTALGYTPYNDTNPAGYITSASLVWGSITGTLASQTDLQAALDLKAPKNNPTFTNGVISDFITLGGATPVSTTYVNVGVTGTIVSGSVGMKVAFNRTDAGGGTITGFRSDVLLAGAVTAFNMIGMNFGVGTSLSGATLTNGQGMQGNITNVTGATFTTATGGSFGMVNQGTGTTWKGIDISIINSGTLTNTYGLYIGDVTSGTQTNQAFSIYSSDANAINYFGGKVGIGSLVPSEMLDVTGNAVISGNVTMGTLLKINAATGNPEFDFQEAGTTRAKTYYDVTNDRLTFQNNQNNNPDALYFADPATFSSNIIAVGSIAGSNLSGTNTGDQTISLTGDVTGSGTGSFAATLATVNGNVGSFTYSSITVNAKGLITAASSGAAPEVPLTFSNGLTRTSNTVRNNLITGLAGGQTIIGGTAVTDKLQYQGTTGNGTLTAIAHQWLVGNNGATTSMVILNNGGVLIGATSTTQSAKLEVVGASGFIFRAPASGNSAEMQLLNDQNNINRQMIVGYGGTTGGVRWTNGHSNELGYWGTVGNFPVDFVSNATYRGSLLGSGQWVFGNSLTAGNIVSIYAASANTSGLRFLRMNSGTTASGGAYIGVDGNGDVVTMATPSSGTPGGAEGQIQWYNGGSFAGAARALIDSNGEIYIEALNNTGIHARVGGVIYDLYTTYGISGSGPEIMSTYLVDRNVLSNFGDKITFECSGRFEGTGSEVRISLEWKNQEIWNSRNTAGGAVTITPLQAGTWYLKGFIIMSDSDTIRVSGTLTFNDGLSTYQVFNDYIELGGANLSGSNDLDILGYSGAGNPNDVILYKVYLEYKPYWHNP